jgi:hypothetical protein
VTQEHTLTTLCIHMGTDPNFSSCVVDTANFCISQLFQAVGFLHIFPIIAIEKEKMSRDVQKSKRSCATAANAKAPLHSCSHRVLVWCK